MPQWEPASPHDRVPTYVLTERRAEACALAPADVVYLLAEHRAHVALDPTAQPGVYRLTPRGHVGTIVGPSCRLLIRPKLALEDLFHLIDPTGPLHLVSDRTTPVSGTEVLDFLAAQLARLLEERARAGLQRGYVERAAQGPFLQGRLDVPAQLRQPAKDSFQYHHDDFTLDVPCNQLPRATAELVLSSPLLGDAVRPVLRRALQPFASVTSVSLNVEHFAATLADRLLEPHRALLELCRLLAEGLMAGERSGEVACPAFLLNLEQVFERYVTRGIVEAFAGREGYRVAVQPLHVVGRREGQPDLQMRPDVVLYRDGEPRCIVDAKWKYLPATRLVVEDVYQVLAYAAALGVRRVVLVYPGKRDRVWKYALNGGQTEVEVRRLRVCGSREACAQSLLRLSRWFFV